jgi:DNA-binding CsgD family transcriptional regulator
MIKKHFWLIKFLITALIIFLALRFERTASVRLFYFVYLAIGYVLVGVVRKFFIRSDNIRLLTFFIDIAIIFALETLTRYVINYALHTFYIVILIDAYLELEKKPFALIGTTAGLASLLKYINMLFLSRSFTKVAETVFFSLFTIFIIFTVYLLKEVKEEKGKTEMVYKELLATYKELEGKYKNGMIEFEPEPIVEELTEREKEICRLIGDGRNNKEISEALFISEGTVKNHITNILKKIELRDRTQLAVFALRNRI